MINTENVRNPESAQVESLRGLMLAEIDAIDRIATPFAWEDRELYPLWLAQTYYYVAHTTRLLALAAAKAPISKEWMYARFVREIHEENGHELLLVKDLKSFSRCPQDYPELPETAFFYQTLSYLIQNENPLCILGYSLTLEGLSAIKTDAYYARAVAAHGKQACHFLYVHSEVDKSHFKAGLEFLEKYGNEDLAAIRKGVIQCSVIYQGILRSLSGRGKASGTA